MFKFFITLIVFIATLNIAFAEKEVLEDRFKYYRNIDLDRGGEFHKDGPFVETFSIKNRKVSIFTPRISEKTIDIKPRPTEITRAIKNPGDFFKKDAIDAVESFERFSKEYRDCVNSKEWPKKTECLKKFDVCFGKDYEGSVCDWTYHKDIRECTTQEEGRLGLIRCLSSKEKLFNLFSKCFDPYTDLFMMFNIFGPKAERRDYYTLDTSYYSDATGQIYCRFTVMKKNEFQLVEIYEDNAGRPGFTMIPLDTYLKDNYYELLKSQKLYKKLEREEKHKEKKKN